MLKLLIALGIALQVFSGIADLKLNSLSTTTQILGIFSGTIISKVFMNHLYVSQGYSVHKIDIMTGTLISTFISTYSRFAVNDFVVFQNGTKMAVCYDDIKIIIWDTESLGQIRLSLLVSNCLSINYIADVNRFITTHQIYQVFCLLNDQLRMTQVLPTNGTYKKHRMYISADKKTYVKYKEDFSFQRGLLTYNSTDMNLTILDSGSTSNPSSYFGNNVFVAQNCPFSYYFIDSLSVTQIAYNTGFNIINTEIISSPQIIAFVQVGASNERWAYVLSTQPNIVHFRGENNIHHSISLSQNIKGIEVNNDKTVLILILQSQIRAFEFVCQNGASFDASIFDCIPSKGISKCFQGTYQHSSICMACHSSCHTCQNSTGCLTCVPSLVQINIGLLCNSVALDISQFLLASITIPTVFRIPLQRSILISIGEFWIYNYHNYTYGVKVNQVFQTIQNIQKIKWALFQFDKYLNISLREAGFSDYSGYSNPQFLKVQQKSSIFIESIFEMIVYYTPVVVAIFLIYRYIFYKTYNYRISRHFRKNSLNAYLFFAIFDGNIQYISYCCFNQAHISFHFSYMDRINGLVWVIFFFCITVFASASYYIVYWLYPKLSKRFIEQAYRIFPSFTVYTVINTGKSFCLGAIQSLLFHSYIIQMLAVLAVHSSVIIVIIITELSHGVFLSSILFHTLVIQNIIRAMICLMFIVQHSVQQGDNDAFNIIEDVLIVLLYVWAIVLMFRMVLSFLPQQKTIGEPLQNINSQKQVKAWNAQNGEPINLIQNKLILTVQQTDSANLQNKKQMKRNQRVIEIRKEKQMRDQIKIQKNKVSFNHLKVGFYKNTSENENIQVIFLQLQNK